MNNPEGDPETLLSSILLFTANQDIGYLVLLVVASLVLLLFSALISGSEVAFFSLKGEELAIVNEANSNKDRLIANLLDKPRELLATILISNNLINIAIVILLSMVIGEVLTFQNEIIEFLVQVVLVTFLLIVLGEVTPKIYAQNQNLKMSRLMALPMFMLVKLLWPFSLVLVSSSRFFEKRIKKYHNELSIEELNEAIELTSDEETSPDEKNILKGIVNFGNTSVKQIMRSRHDVIAYDLNTSLSTLMTEINNHRYSRLPIYEDNFDKVKGVLYVKDLIAHLDEPDFNWQSLIRKPYFVPEMKKIDDLLRDFQEKKVHMAIVVDEYGGSQGLVTMEDILEEIVGEINDEFDTTPDAFYSILDDYNVVFDGKTSLSDVLKVFNLSSETFDAFKTEVESIGGLVVELTGKIPEAKEIIRYKNFVFTVEASDSKRVRRVKMTVEPNDLNSEEN